MTSGIPRILVVCLALAAGLVPSTASANWVGGIEFDHPSPSWLPHGEYVNVSIDCKVDQPISRTP